MVNILDPREGESIYDPACGTGGMLLEAVHHVRENHGDDRTLWGKLFGQEKNYHLRDSADEPVPARRVGFPDRAR
jgi:type I restriction-modification system DNA methylase subunit